jgi:hypothetical protein
VSLIVYGASDDLVEIEGDIREEFNHGDGEPSYLAVSDGTVLRITYDGQWHISRITEGAAEYAHDPATAEDGDPRDDEYKTPCYSDRVTLTGMGDLPLAWVVFGDRFEAARDAG